jgi:hypothetical protein
VAETTISNLHETSTVEDRQVFPVEDNVSTKKMAIGTFRNFLMKTLMREVFYGVNFCVDTSRYANKIEISLPEGKADLKDGLRLLVMCRNANTEENVSIVITNTGASVSVVDSKGNPPAVDSINSNCVREFVYWYRKFYLMTDSSSANKDLSNLTIKGNGRLLPAGSIIAFAGKASHSYLFGLNSSALLVGYLYCDGAELNRTTYSNLFAAIGTIYGVGDSSNAFKIPDFRGGFLRSANGDNAVKYYIKY